jgi:hypothetical protein
MPNPIYISKLIHTRVANEPTENNLLLSATVMCMYCIFNLPDLHIATSDHCQHNLYEYRS